MRNTQKIFIRYVLHIYASAYSNNRTVIHNYIGLTHVPGQTILLFEDLVKCIQEKDELIFRGRFLEEVLSELCALLGTQNEIGVRGFSVFKSGGHFGNAVHYECYEHEKVDKKSMTYFDSGKPSSKYHPLPGVAKPMMNTVCVFAYGATPSSFQKGEVCASI